MDAVLFDLDDTLYDQVTPFEKAFAKTVGPTDLLDVPELFRMFRHHSDLLFEASVDGRLSVERMRVLRFQRACADSGIIVSDETAAAFQETYAWNQYHAIEVTPTINDLLAWCAENVRMAIVTNGPSKHQRAKVRALGLEKWFPADRVLVSEDLGVAKPDAEMFLRAARALGTAVDDCVFVGDSPANDVAGANAAGMPVVWFDRRGMPLVEGTAPTWTVTREEEILPLLKTLR